MIAINNDNFEKKSSFDILKILYFIPYRVVTYSRSKHPRSQVFPIPV